MSVLKEKIKELGLTPQEIKLIACLGCSLLSRKDFDKKVLKLPSDRRRIFKQWVTWSNSSDYWRGVWRILSRNPTPERCKLYDVKWKDILWLEQHVPAVKSSYLKEIRSLKEVSIKKLNVFCINVLLEELQQHCKVMVNRKLRFIVTYDQSTSTDDLVSDLMGFALKAVYRYESIYDKTKILGYAKRAIHNRAINLIKKYTTKKRAKILGSLEIETLREFQTTTAPIDYVVKKIVDLPKQEEVIYRISQRLGTSHELYARAILGSFPAFDNWVRRWLNKEPNQLTPNQLNTIACNWLGLDPEKVKQELGNYLKGGL